MTKTMCSILRIFKKPYKWIFAVVSSMGTDMAFTRTNCFDGHAVDFLFQCRRVIAIAIEVVPKVSQRPFWYWTLGRATLLSQFVYGIVGQVHKLI